MNWKNKVKCKVCGKELERVHNTKRAICVNCKKEYNKKKRERNEMKKEVREKAFKERR